MNRNVLNETMNAYADCNNRENRGVERNLSFRASEPVSPADAVKIMAKALACRKDEKGYNDFRPELLERLPKDSQVWLAREGSVCVYFKTPTVLMKGFQDLMAADEWDPAKNGETRLWWD